MGCHLVSPVMSSSPEVDHKPRGKDFLVIILFPELLIKILGNTLQEFTGCIIYQ